ncbi:DUF4145 domain-containing protein [Bacillus sp. DX1.1]|uniref:DUF4145 domain-containing protein n=1 Tax=unclassified Bacillus (in: firmicutes) TaxID=185979 RepID=UPI002570227D|nr:MULTISPECIES: DUF4145 domain-containing protein [unclassified Bacillus (in: firmicutes)]MDM5153175.1 DUF4145 domain-containing protein [Bacillus sp. DX1.1]WJE82143.1 DUF4145 domain-containing protein [Bacillus sp. DX3.1]
MPNHSLFEFVGQFSSELAELAHRIENQLLDQPHASMMQARLYSEQLVKIVSKEEGLEDIYPLKHSEKIHKLYRQNLIEEDIYMKLEWIRKKGNKAVHDVKEVDIHDVLQAHKFLFEISVWYMQVYVSYDFEPPIYNLPIKVSKETNPLEAKDFDGLIKPYLDQKIDEMWSEVQQQLEAIREEKGQGPESVVVNEAANKMSKVPENLSNVFLKNNFHFINKTTKAAEFENINNKEVVYLLPNKELTVVIHPNTAENHSSLKSESAYHNTGLKKFPKKINNGKTPTNYGYPFKFQTEAELDSFLNRLGNI